MIVDRKKSTVRTFKVKSACGEKTTRDVYKTWLYVLSTTDSRQGGKSHKLSQ